jgi:hypothetical protein
MLNYFENIIINQFFIHHKFIFSTSRREKEAAREVHLRLLQQGVCESRPADVAHRNLGKEARKVSRHAVK